MMVSRYNFFVPTFFKDTVIAYNSLTGSILFLSQKEFERASEILYATHAYDRDIDLTGPLAETLVDKGFIASSHEDERAQVRRRYHETRVENQNLNLTIVPTISCNFGCSYCFQEHPRKRMGPEKVAAVKRYVEGNLVRGTSLNVTWFGGEPMLAFDTIMELSDYFKTLCRDRECAFGQSIITNGYLLEHDKVDVLVSYKNITFVQITLDGPPEVHDQRRMSANKRGTFDRIMRNIEHAAGKLPISIRVNVDRTNYRQLNRFLDIIVERGLQDRVGLYVAHVLPYTDVCSDVASIALTREEFAQIESQFEFRMFQMGFRSSIRLPVPRSGSVCTADNPAGAVIGPDGLIFRCWNEVAAPAAAKASNPSPSVGDGASPRMGSGQYKKGLNQALFQAYDPFTHEACCDCKVQPLCHGGCPWEARKNPTWSTGHCTPLKFNLPDKLRLVHLQSTIHSACIS